MLPTLSPAAADASLARAIWLWGRATASAVVVDWSVQHGFKEIFGSVLRDVTSGLPLLQTLKARAHGAGIEPSYAGVAIRHYDAWRKL
ncbi:hypothetical protein [Nonomuraea africana]|uniref:Uncharacterized protein n=1 Tax=Nonomuraea africana TaxID=46171 RepID=A0ABR9K6J6_9ACTN|nr:hypothetical protein [Nonomuraea africana]MBE1557515.1 hypothetical protein [Nonomuraea africana]